MVIVSKARVLNIQTLGLWVQVPLKACWHVNIILCKYWPCEKMIPHPTVLLNV